MVFVFAVCFAETSFGFTIPDDAKIEKVFMTSDEVITIDATATANADYSFDRVRSNDDLKIVALESFVSGTKINCSSNLTSTEDLSVPESEGSYNFNDKEIKQINSSNYRRARDGLMWCLSK